MNHQHTDGRVAREAEDDGVVHCIGCCQFARMHIVELSERLSQQKDYVRIS